MNRHWIWKSAVAGLCGSLAHLLLMYFKSKSGLLPSFQPYQSLQLALSQWTGSNVNPLVPWALSFLNGLTIVGFVFGRSYSRLPGSNGAAKGLLFGLLMWVVMGTGVLSADRPRSVRHRNRTRRLAGAVLARNAADLQRRDGPRLSGASGLNDRVLAAPQSCLRIFLHS